jgi:hypothetical protein
MQAFMWDEVLLSAQGTSSKISTTNRKGRLYSTACSNGNRHIVHNTVDCFRILLTMSWVWGPHGRFCEEYGLLRCKEKDRSFGGIYRVHLQDRKVSYAKNQKQPVSSCAGFLLVLLFNPKNGGNIFHRKYGISPGYTGLRSRRPYSSLLIFGFVYIHGVNTSGFTKKKYCYNIFSSLNRVGVSHYYWK